MKYNSIVLLLTLFVTNALAAEYYVSPTGTETWPDCTTVGSPCGASNTVKDFLGASAGDTVFFLDGTYSGLQMRDQDGAYREPVWFASNVGSSGLPITFKALNSRMAILIGLGDAGASSQTVAVIGCDDSETADYSIWDGFVIKAVESDGTTPMMAKASFYYGDHNIVTNCEIIGVSHATGGASNYEGVRMEGTDYTTVTNCDIHGFNETSEDSINTSAIRSYDSSYADISNNNLYDNSYQIYIKGFGNSNFTIAYNYFDDGIICLLDPTRSGTEHAHIIHNNLFNDCLYAFSDEGDEVYDGFDWKIYNNTIFSSKTDAQGILAPNRLDLTVGTGADVYNNIIYLSGSGTVWSLQTRGSGNKLGQADHNLYYPSINTYIPRYGNSYSTLSAWQSSIELEANYDAGCGSNQNPGCNSVVSDPLFVNTSGNLNEIADFALDTSSPAIAAGRSGADMGADVTLVGANAGSTGTGALQAGTGIAQAGTGAFE